jgi:hypothetical protein
VALVRMSYTAGSASRISAGATGIEGMIGE